MSQLQDDKKVLEGSRRKLESEEIKAPLRDQIDSKLLRKLRKDDYGQKVDKLWATAAALRQPSLARQQTWLKDWDRFIIEDQEGAYAGTSNLHIPMSFTVLKTYHARFLQAWSANETLPKARRPDAVDRERMVGETLKYALKDWANMNEGVDKVVDEWIWNWCQTGAGTLKSRWDLQFEKFMDVVEVATTETRFVVDEQGNETAIPVPSTTEEAVEVIEKVFEGPQLENVFEEDFLMTGGDGDPQTADAVMHAQWPTASELWTLVDRKIFAESAVRAVIAGGPDNEYNSAESGIKQQRKEQGGDSSLETDTDHDRYRVIEVYTKYDADGSGIGSEIVAWVAPKSREVLRATYLRRANKSGKRPFFRIEFHRRPGSPHPIGLVEILFPLAKEMDAMHNMRIDAGLISTMPFGFYRATSSLEPETIKYEPGSLIPVDDPQKDVFFPNIGNRSQFGLQEEQAIQVMVERLTGISDLSLGVQSGTQGAARTATGVRGLMGEANANLDVHLRRLFRGWRQYLRHLLHMLQQRIPEGLSFKVTGDDGQNYWAQIQTRQEIAGDFDFSIDPSSADSNPAVREQRATEVLQQVYNPLAIQLGLVTQSEIFEAQKNFYMSKGIRDWSKYVRKPSQVQHLMTPEEEANRVLRGINVPVTMEMDHEGFIAYFDFIMKTPEQLGMMDEQSLLRLAAQNQAHQQMLAALQQQAAQQRNQAQMQQNASQAMGQASAGVSPLPPGPVGQ